MKKNTKRREILNRLKKSNKIYGDDYDSLAKELEIDLENEFENKKDKLTSLLFEKELLINKINSLLSHQL